MRNLIQTRCLGRTMSIVQTSKTDIGNFLSNGQKIHLPNYRIGKTFPSYASKYYAIMGGEV